MKQVMRNIVGALCLATGVMACSPGPAPPPAADDKAAPVHQALLEQKVITGTSSNPKVLRLLPPLCLQKEHIDLFVEKVILAADERG